ADCYRFTIIPRQQRSQHLPYTTLFRSIVTHIFAVIWWFVMPTWPLGTTYTKGLLNTDQHKIVEERLVQANAARASWVDAIETARSEEHTSELQSRENLVCRHLRQTQKT